MVDFSASSLGYSRALAPPEKAPSVLNAEDYSRVLPGGNFTDHNGVVRTKPAASAPDQNKFSDFYGGLPEGSHYIDPQGVARIKPETGALSFGAQVLFDMARTPKGKRDALRYSYGPQAVVDLPNGELAVRHEGRFLKPAATGHIEKTQPSEPSRVPGHIAGMVAENLAPMVGAAAGEVLGSAVGASTGPGAVVTGALGAGAGLLAGNAFNDLILSMVGIDTGTTEQRREQSNKDVLFGMGGSVAGRAVGAAAPVVGSVFSGAHDLFSEGVSGVPRKLWEAVRDNPAAPRAVGYVLGAEKGPAERAARLSGEGVKVPPSAWLQEAPYLQKVVEQFDPLFRLWEPLKRSASEFYERSAGSLLGRGGAIPSGKLLEPTAAVSSQAAGETVLRRVAADAGAANARLDAAADAMRLRQEGVRRGEEATRQSRLAFLGTAEAEARQQAQKTVDLALSETKKSTAAAMKAVAADQHPGDLWRRAGEQLDKVHLGIEANAARGYAAGHAAAGEEPLVLSAGNREADELLNALPPDFRNNFPEMTAKLAKLGKGKEGAVTLQELHEIRNLARSKVDRFAPYADLREGLNRKVAGIVNRIMHDPGQSSVVKDGVAIIDRWDRYYEKNMGQYEAEAVNTIVEKMRTGPRGAPLVGDAGMLADLVFKPESTAARETARKLLGPQLWKAVHAADVDRIVAESAAMTGGIDAGRFATRVMERVRSGVWTDADLSPRVLHLAQQISAIEGKIPIEHVEGDTVGTMLRRAVDYADEAKELARADPLGALQKETQRIERARTRLKTEAARSRRQQPIGFLEEADSVHDLTAIATESADRIIGNPNHMIAAARRFGPDSTEFDALRKVAVQRLFETGSLAKTGRLRHAMAELPPEAQEILFPGVTRDAALQLAQDMEFLIGPAAREDFGGSLAAASRVLHPATTLGIHSKLAQLPGVSSFLRYTLGTYYKAITYGVTHPGFIQWVNKGLSGPPAARAAARDAFRSAVGIGGPLGAASAALLDNTQTGGKRRMPERQRSAPMRPVGSAVPTARALGLQ